MIPLFYGVDEELIWHHGGGRSSPFGTNRLIWATIVSSLVPGSAVPETRR